MNNNITRIDGTMVYIFVISVFCLLRL